MRLRPVSARAGSPMVLLPAAVLTLPAYQCLVRVESAEQAQSRQAARAALLAWWLRHGRSQLERSARLRRFFAQLWPESAIEREVCRRTWMQRQVPVARMSAVRLVSARVMLLRVTGIPVGASHAMHGDPRRENPLGATWGMPARVTAVPGEPTWVVPAWMTAVPREATWGVPAWMTAKVVEAAPAILIRTSAAPTLVPPGVSPSRVVERPAQAKAPPSACRAGP
jgi:hypothetical protein